MLLIFLSTGRGQSYFSCHVIDCLLKTQNYQCCKLSFKYKKLKYTEREKQESSPTWGAPTYRNLKFLFANMVARKAAILFCSWLCFQFPLFARIHGQQFKNFMLILMTPVWLLHLYGPGETKLWQLRLGSMPHFYSKQFIWKQCGAVGQHMFTKPAWGLTFYLKIQKSRSGKQN